MTPKHRTMKCCENKLLQFSVTRYLDKNKIYFCKHVYGRLTDHIFRDDLK